MRRRDLVPFLLDRWWTAHALARELRLSERGLEDDLEHLARSLRHSPEHRFVVEPAHCKKCGFTFRDEKLSRPGKCPKCRETWIEAARFSVERRTPGEPGPGD